MALLKDLNELSVQPYEEINTKMNQKGISLEFALLVIQIVVIFVDEMRRAIKGKKIKWYSFGTIAMIVKAVLKMVKSFRQL